MVLLSNIIIRKCSSMGILRITIIITMFQFVTIDGGDDTFWSNSPSRSESPSPNHLQNSIADTYEIYAQLGCSKQNRYSTYKAAYSTINSESDVSTHMLTTGTAVRVVKRRTTANKKERRRTHSINSAYISLRDCIPNVPADTKLSKIKTLRLATSYISYLTRALETDDTVGGFKAELGTISRKSSNNSVHLNDCTSDRVFAKEMTTEEMSNTRRSKGRTGWPQHVWALELKQEQAL
ncbi:unnamed protein product [Phaedon cochleariae]|uniref:BHLH domain-containing protein n=1 Tax=Phaedon cochleariae TaxID=80249 RepID=A0A9P0GTN2_PHACE|nr:unnamed protein product [Phaedon cochleariae]